MRLRFRNAGNVCLASFDRRERCSEFFMVPLANGQVPRLAIGD
jgi:hypothetical protein